MRNFFITTTFFEFMLPPSDGIQRNATSLKREKQLLSLAAWNVCTTNDSDTTIRPERATAIICKELKSEVRHPGSGNIKERSHTIFWSGDEDRTIGVGFAISNKLGHINPVPVNNRLGPTQ